MGANLHVDQSNSADPIIEELHQVREQLVHRYGGDLHRYSEAARAHALALGFQFIETGKAENGAADCP
jgi:hypothetical protein